MKHYIFGLFKNILHDLFAEKRTTLVCRFGLEGVVGMSSFLIFDIDILFRFGLEGVAVIEASITIFLGCSKK